MNQGDYRYCVITCRYVILSHPADGHLVAAASRVPWTAPQEHGHADRHTSETPLACLSSGCGPGCRTAGPHGSFPQPFPEAWQSVVYYLLPVVRPFFVNSYILYLRSCFIEVKLLRWF